MTNLSPAAQAVLDAAFTLADNLDRDVTEAEMIAAALRAAVERLGYELELEDLSSTTLYVADANCLLDIADELEAQ